MRVKRVSSYLNARKKEEEKYSVRYRISTYLYNIYLYTLLQFFFLLEQVGIGRCISDLYLKFVQNYYYFPSLK